MPQIQLIITMEENGNVGVNGPLENRMLCYGMMEMAKDAIREYAANSRKLVQEVPPGTRLVPLPGGRASGV